VNTHCRNIGQFSGTYTLIFKPVQELHCEYGVMMKTVLFSKTRMKNKHDKRMWWGKW